MGTLSIQGRYYSRLLVPVDLRPLLQRSEIRKSLRTSSYRDAKLLAAQWEGRLANLFDTLRRNGHTMNVDQIKRLAQQYLDASLEECEEAHLDSTPNDDESEALSLALTDALDETACQLATNDFTKIAPEVDSLLSSRKLQLAKTSDAYRRLCSELLKAKQVVLKAELDRWDGNYWSHTSAAYSPRTSATHAGGNGSGTPEESRLLSDALQDYFKHYEHRDARTNHEKHVIFTRFAEAIGGDRPLSEITKAACVQFRDMYSKLPKRIGNDLRGKGMIEVLAAVDGKDSPSDKANREPCSGRCTTLLLMGNQA